MDVLELIRTLDGGISIGVLLWVGWRVEVVFSSILDRQQNTIDRLIDCDDDEG